MRTPLWRNTRPRSASLLRNIFAGSQVSARTVPEFQGVTQNGGDRIDLSWVAVPGASSYDLQSSTNGGTTWSALVTQAGTTYSHTGLSFPGSYTYRVRAVVNGVNSDWSASVTETMVDVPAAPGGLTVTGATTSSISLSWNDTADEGSYLVEVSVDGLGSWSSAGSTNQNVVTFTHSGLAESVQRHYRVTAFNKAGGSIPSSTANSWTVPAAPTGLTATVISSSQIDLSWTDVSTGNTSYKVERSTDNVNWTEIATGLSATATTYSATGLTASTQYWFRVRAANAARNSDYSSSASATTASSTPTAAWTLDFSSGTPSGYTLTRASSGTYVDSSGYVASASTDVARLTHNSSGSRLGLLVEGQRANLVFRSEDLTTTWTNTNTTETGNAATAPDNNLTADELIESAGTTVNRFIASNLISFTSGVTYTASVYAKANSATCMQIFFGSGAFGTGAWATFNVSAGTVGSVGATVTTADRSITDVGNGWYRCTLTQTATGTSNQSLNLCLTNNTATTSRAPTYTVTAGNERGLYLWGAQFEVAATVSSYIPTVASSVTRSADLAHVLDSSITSWGDPGALVVHFYPPLNSGTLISTDNASTAQIGIEAQTSATTIRGMWSSGQTATSNTSGTGVQKAVHYWNGTNSRFCLNGGTVQTGTNNLTIGNTDFVTLGAESTESGGTPNQNPYTDYANCIIRKVEFYSGTLTDANLQTITT